MQNTRIVSEQSIRNKVAGNVIERLRGDQEAAANAVTAAEQARAQAEEALKRFYRFSWNRGTAKGGNGGGGGGETNANDDDEEHAQKLAELQQAASAASAALTQARTQLATITSVRQQHEQALRQAETVARAQQQQSDQRSSSFSLAPTSMSATPTTTTTQNEDTAAAARQLQELHRRAEGRSLLISTRSNVRTPARTVFPSSSSSQSQEAAGGGAIHPNQNVNSNNHSSNTPAAAVQADYAGGNVVVPSSNRVEVDRKPRRNNKPAAKRQAGKIRGRDNKNDQQLQHHQAPPQRRDATQSRLDKLALSDEDGDDTSSTSSSSSSSSTSSSDGTRRGRGRGRHATRRKQKREVKQEDTQEQDDDEDEDDEQAEINRILFGEDGDADLDQHPEGASDLEGDNNNDDDEEDDAPTAEDLVPIRIIDTHDYFCPKYVWESLLGYQQEALRWLCGLHRKRVGSLLGDEMGLGKTVQTAAYLHSLMFSGKLAGSALVIAPLTVLAQWRRELQKWCVCLPVVVLHSMEVSMAATAGKKSSAVISAAITDQVRGKKVVALTTYSTFAKNVEEFVKGQFDCVVLDEGHKISNPEAAVSVAAKAIPTTNRLILTGSPIQNSLIEIWSLFDFCCPGLLGGAVSFVQAFEEPIKASRNPQATPLQLATAVECAKTLRDQIAPYMLRRLKKDVNRMLPKKYEKAVMCSLTDAQLQSYVDVLASSEARQVERQHFSVSQELQQLDRHGRERRTGSLVLLGVDRKRSMRGMMHRAWELLADLRSICNHVDIFKTRTAVREEAGGGGGGQLVATNDDGDGSNNNVVVGQTRRNNNNTSSGSASLNFRSNKPVDYSGSAKLTALAELLDQWQPLGHKVLIFCQTRMMLDIIENCVNQKNFRYIRMDGTTPGASRHELVHKFNHDKTIFAALLTTRVGGLGLNLTGANRVVLFDPDWNPVVDEQARERAWRIGQTREVEVYRLISSGTIEEHILHRQMAKMFVTEKVLSDPTLQRFFSIHSLVDAFRLGGEYAARVSETCHGSIIATSISLKPSIQNELTTHHTSGTTTTTSSSNSNAAAGTTMTLQRREHQPQHQNNDAVKQESGEEDHHHRQQQKTHLKSGHRIVDNPVDAPSRSQISHGRSTSSSATAPPSSSSSHHRQIQLPQQQSSSSSSGGGGGDTGVIAALVDGKNDDEEGVIRRAQNTSEMAKRLAQLSALSTLKRALTGPRDPQQQQTQQQTPQQQQQQQRKSRLQGG